MGNFLDKLNTPRALIIVLVPFLIVDGFLFYRYQQLTTSAAADFPQAAAELSAATLPEDAVSATDNSEEDGADDEQEEAGTKERADDEADSSTSEEKVGPEAQETKPEQEVPAPTPYPPPAPLQPVEEPALVAAEDPDFSPAPLPASGYYPDESPYEE